MKNLVPQFSDFYLPEKALVIFKSQTESKFYIESYDMDDEGCPINAHPLSVQEANSLALVLDSSSDLQQGFLMSKGILPNNVLYINSNNNGYAIWHTPAMRADLFFNNFLPIPDGVASVPPLLWKASKKGLHIWSLAKNTKPVVSTPLFNAPFFNIDASGQVCMGSVDIKISPSTTLEDFMEKWQCYFFNSRFSHLIADAPTKHNIVQLWQGLMNADKPFPMKTLKKTKFSLKNIL